VNFGSEFCVFDECCSFSFAIQQMKLLGDHLSTMFYLRMQRKYGDRNVCRFFIRVTGADLPVFQSLENAHFGGAFYAVFRDDFTDLHENLQKSSSLVQEWRRRFEFFAFHLHSKKIPA
jgi:hypothetical protein